MSAQVDAREGVFTTVSRVVGAPLEGTWQTLTESSAFPFGNVDRPGAPVEPGSEYEWGYPGARQVWPRWRVVEAAHCSRQVHRALERPTQRLNGWPDVAVVVDLTPTDSAVRTRVDAAVHVRPVEGPVGYSAMTHVPFTLHHLEADLKTALSELGGRTELTR